MIDRWWKAGQKHVGYRPTDDEIIAKLRTGWCFDLLNTQLSKSIDPLCVEVEEPAVLHFWRTFHPRVSYEDLRRRTSRRANPVADCELVRVVLENVSESFPKVGFKKHRRIPKSTIKKAFTIIYEVSPQTYKDMFRHQLGIVELTGFPGISFSKEDMYGIVFLNEGKDVSPASLAVTLVHEFAHQELFLLGKHDKLVSEAGVSNRQFSTFQKQDRPTAGRLHAAHALFRMTEFIQKAGWNTTPNEAVFLSEIIETLDGSLLTPLGSKLISERYKTVI